MKSNLTLQINSLEALERLIGNDTAAEMEIRNSIVQKFAGKYLKPIAETVFSGIRKEIEKQVSNEIAEFNKVGWQSSVVLNQQYKEMIRAEVLKNVNSVIKESCASAITELGETIEDAVDRRVKRVGDEYVAACVNKRVSEKMERIKSQIL